MKRLQAQLERYRKRAAQRAAQPPAMPSQGRRRGGCATDPQTVLYLCNKFLRQEYGARGAQAVRAVRYKNTVVILTVESALWAQEVWMHRAALMRYVNTMCREEVVTKIVADTH